MAETRESTSTRKRTRARGTSTQRRTRARRSPHESAHPREGAPARRELNPGTRARLRWLRLAAAGGGMAAASFRQRASRSVRRRLPRYFTKANLRVFGDGCRCVPLRHISKCSAMGIFLRDAFSTDRQWRDLPRDAFSTGRQWQDFSVMRSPLNGNGKIFA